MQWFLIVLSSTLVCVLYGVIHDQFTARICLEYFTVGHPPIFDTQDPTLLALGWGVVASWWVGLILGIPLAAAARLGPRPQRSARSLIRPLAVLALAVGCWAAVIGSVAWFAATRGWISLSAEMATKLQPDQQLPYLVDLWIHNASYAGGCFGALCLMAWVWWTRIVLDRQRRRTAHVTDTAP